MSQSLRAAALLALMLAAGCLDADHPPPAPPDPGAGAAGRSVPPPRLELVGCEAFLLEYWTDQAHLRPFLPPGYEARPALGPLVGVAVTAYTCRSAVLDGQAVVPDLQWLQVHSSVRAPAAVASNGTSDQFLFELLVSDPSVQALLAEEGVTAGLGRVEAERQGSATRLRVFQDGGLLYEYQGAGEVGESRVDHAEARRYHEAADGTPSSFDATWTGTLSSYKAEETGVLSAHAGFVAQTLPAPGGSTVTGRGAAAGTLLFDFPPSHASASASETLPSSTSSNGFR
jgi:hypothetical protein